MPPQNFKSLNLCRQQKTGKNQCPNMAAHRTAGRKKCDTVKSERGICGCVWCVCGE